MLGLVGMGGGAASLMWVSGVSIASGALYVWGLGNHGTSSLNNPSAVSRRSSPTQVGTDTDWSFLSDGAQQSDYVALRGKKDGTMWVAGSPRDGGSGDIVGLTGLNNDVKYSSPIQLGTDSNWTGTTTVGRNYRLATKTDGTLWAWGVLNDGVLGLNQGGNASLSSPTQVGTDTTWAITKGSIAAVKYASVAIKANGTLWSWGQNQEGQMGFGDQPQTFRRSSPVQVGTDTTWKTVAGDQWGSFVASKTDGSLWGWGANFQGGLGLNVGGPSASRSSPTRIGTDTTWSGAINIGNSATMATKTDGTLWVWGYNTGVGVLGLSDTARRSSPCQLPGTDWDKDGDMMTLASTTYGRAAVKTDGSLWAWGENELGQLGLNDKTPDSSPRQISGTTWIAVGGLSQGKSFHAIKQ